MSAISEMIDELEDRMRDLFISTNRGRSATPEQDEILEKMYQERENLYKLQELQEELNEKTKGKPILEYLKDRELGRGRIKHYSSPLFRVYGKKKGGNDDELRKHLEWMQSIPSPNAPYGKDIWGNPKNSMGWSPYEHFSGYGSGIFGSLPNLDQYIGKSGEIVQKILKKNYPDFKIVLVTPGMMMTADYRMDRIKISVDNDGMVERITQG
jgi:hypothetical protein